MKIEKIRYNQYKNAISLIWEVFLDYTAPDYTEKGVETFRNLINDNEVIKSLDFLCAFEENKLIGLLATKNKNKHICFFFIKSEFQNKGIGKALWKTLLDTTTNTIFTVNSSPYAVPIYHKLGFVSTDTEQEYDGIRFTPMEYIRNI